MSLHCKSFVFKTLNMYFVYSVGNLTKLSNCVQYNFKWGKFNTFKIVLFVSHKRCSKLEHSLLCIMYMYFSICKGTVSRDFRPLFFI